MRKLNLICFALALLTSGCRSSKILDKYYQYNTSERLNIPADYINFLKQTRFTNGELDHLPPCGIIFYGDVSHYLSCLGFSSSQLTLLKTGTSDPTVVIVVKNTAGADFMIEQGLPGGGGVTTQAGELAALGAKYIVHIGTCAALGPSIAEGQIIVSHGSYKDGAGILLSEPEEGDIQSLAEPDEGLTKLLREQLSQQHADSFYGVGFTSPIFYFEPSGLYIALLSSRGSNFRADYVEMEQGPFFTMADRMHASAASLVVPDDRHTLEGHKLLHNYLDQKPTEQAIQMALGTTIKAFSILDKRDKARDAN